MSTNALARPQSSRRTFLTAGTAALVGAGTVGTAAAASFIHPDAVLIELGSRREAVQKLEDAAWGSLEEIEDAFTPPEPPETLFRLSTDWSLFWGFTGTKNYDGRYWYGSPASIHYLRTERFVKHTLHGATWSEEEQALIPREVPDEKARARAGEIVAAYDAWEQAIRAAQDAAGITAARAVAHPLRDEHTEIREAILRAQANTLDGLIVKARSLEWIVGEITDDDINSDDDGTALSLARSVLRMADERNRK